MSPLNDYGYLKFQILSRCKEDPLLLPALERRVDTTGKRKRRYLRLLVLKAKRATASLFSSLSALPLPERIRRTHVSDHGPMRGLF